MIRVLGAKRIFLLFILISLNVVFAAAVYGYMMPERLKSDTELRNLRSQISTVETDISRLQIEFDQLEEQQEQFKALEKDGFFRSQGRRAAEDLLLRIQEDSRVISAVVSIAPGKIEGHHEAEKAAHKLLVSQIEVKIEAMDDIEVYRYLYLLEKTFPGHVKVDDIDLKRVQNVNAAVLRSIATGESPALVEANIKLSWRTMIPESQVRASQR